MEEHLEARFIVETLSKAGFIAYYAGGWVRDLLLQHPSDDIDIATNAPPETIQALFSHTVPIGIAFGIILVVIKGRPYEVATFRQDFNYKDGRRPSQIAFTTAIEDAKRRDFTINGMFYDPLTGEILDYVGGKEDLQKRIIRAIGNPHERIREDRLRMIRAIRLSCRFGFAIEEKTKEAIYAHARELFPSVAIERIWEEFKKGHAFHKFPEMVLLLHEFHLLSTIFPSLEGVPLEEIARRMAPVKNYPHETPLIASLLPLFPHFSRESQEELVKKLKLPNTDLSFVQFLFSCQAMKNAEDLFLWAHVYADKRWPFVFAILYPQGETSHETRKKRLERAIDRIVKGDPVLKADHLRKEGILPGKKMGKLLKAGEKIAIETGIEDPKEIIERLKQSPLWREDVQ